MDEHEVLVIGGGIAGASLAFELAPHVDVCLLDMESAFDIHSTGRSAAVFIESYGNKPIRALTTASRDVFTSTATSSGEPTGTPLPLLHIARPDSVDALREFHAEIAPRHPEVRLLTPDEAVTVNPLVRREQTALAMLEPEVLALDVNTIHHNHLRGIRARGGSTETNARIVAAEKRNDRWQLRTSRGVDYSADIVVNAAGAWSDSIADVLGVARIGLTPMRRTAFMVDAPDSVRGRSLPMTLDANERFYLKSDGAQLLCSPADETPVESGSPRPDELEIARAIDDIGEMLDLPIRHVRHSWAGLRSFVSDRTPVVGFDPSVDGVFWCAAQGGYGIQTSPALARVGAALLRGNQIPADIADLGLTAEELSPARLRPTP